MCRIYTLIIVCCVSFASYTAYAQSTSTDALESIRQSLTSSSGEEGAEGTSLSDRMSTMFGSSTETASPEEQAPSIKVPIIPDAIEVPEVNQGTAEVIDTLGRYRPRLRINFIELPLRSLTVSNQTENGIPVKGDIPVNMIVQRIKSRFRLSELHLLVKDRNAIISGTVHSEHQRDMIALMLRFVPGIDVVQNDITVVSSP